MKLRITYFSIFLFAFLLFNCNVKVKLPEDYFQSEKKIGVMYIMDSIHVYRMGQQGLLASAIARGRKYTEPLKKVDEVVFPHEKVKKMVNKIFNENGKNIQELDFIYNKKVLARFQKPDTPTSYHLYDLRFLKEEENVDEVVLIKLRYGLLVNYSGVIELGKGGFCRIDMDIINLKDNSLIYKDFASLNKQIKEEWKSPPDYPVLTKHIQLAINGSLGILEYKFK